MSSLPEAAARPARERERIAHAFLRRLDDEGIAWALLGDPQRLASEADGDVDLVVDPARMRELPGVVQRFCVDQGLRLVQACRHEWNALNLGLAWRARGTVELRLLQLDLCGDPGRSGRRFLRARDVLALARTPSGVRVPAPEHAFIAYLLKRIDKGELEVRPLAWLRLLWSEDPRAARAQLERALGPRGAGVVVRAMQSPGTDAALRAAVPALRSLLRRRLRRSALALAREAMRRADRAVRPVGIWLALLGPDGAGKSTVAQGVARELAPLFRASRIYHLRPHLGSGRSPQPPVTDPHGQTPRGRAASLAKLALWWSDCTLGYLLDLYPRMVRAQLLLFDRHAWDLVVDPLRYRYGGPPGAARALARCTFAPPLLVLLDAPLAVIHARKQEVTPAEVQRQRQAYRELARDLRGSEIVDAARPAAVVVADVTDRVLQRMAQRTARRLGLVPLLAVKESEREAVRSGAT